MKKIALMMAFALCAGINANAQITAGESSAKVIKVGNRAQKGDFGLLLGGSLNFQNINDDWTTNFNYLPIVNFKYMASDRLELRLGVDLNKTKNYMSYEIDDADVDDFTRNTRVNNRFLPGVAYHFSPSNVLDVYGGASLPFGWTRDVTKSEDYKQVSSCFKVGGELFIGAQAYIGNLPLAIGVEYGISTMAKCGDGKTHFEAGSDEYYEFNGDFNLPGSHFDKLKTRSTNIDNQVKFTLTYYFK